MNPRTLDWICNGVPVYIRRRPSDGKVYATIHDYSRFIKEEPLATVRVKLSGDPKITTTDDLITDKAVLAKIAEFNK